MDPKDFDKRGKAHPTEVDTSNGALFLRIVELERAVKYQARQIQELQQDANDPVKHNIRIGGS